MVRHKPVVVVGSINTDLVAVASRIPIAGETIFGSDFQVHPGGKGANQAVAVARLGYPVRLIGRLGNDAFGEQLRTHLAAAGVDLQGVATTEGASGVAVIVVSNDGQNIIVVTPGANARVTPQDLDANLEMIREAGIVLTQLEIPLETVEYLAEVCSREGVPLVLDPAPARELPSAIFKHIQWFTPNETEAAFFTRGPINNAVDLNPSEMAKMILSKGANGVVLKMGAHGAYLASRAGLAEAVAAFPVKPVDTTAAGDAFNGGFATGIMLGKSPLESAQFAAAVAGLSVTRQGAQPSMPTMTEVEAYIESESARIGCR